MPRPLSLLRAAIPLVLLSALLAACGGAAPAAAPTSAPAAAATAAPAAAATAAPAAEATAAPAAEQPTAAAAEAPVDPKTTLIFGGDFSDMLTLDPAVVYEFSGIQAVGSVYQTLVTIVPGDPTVKPLLATKWDIKDTPDGWVMTFNLDPKAKFASGNPVTADDVAYSWGRVFDLNKSPAFLFTDVAGIKKDSFKAVDKQTFQVTLPKASSPQVFLTIMSNTIAAVEEKALVEKNAGSDFGSSWLNDNSAGSGPYVLTRWERNSQVVLDQNPNYWGEAPKLKKVIMRFVTEQTNLQSGLEAGDIDIAQDLAPEQSKALEGNADVQLVKANSTLLTYLGMNAKSAPLDNADVRQAIRYAINYDDINTLLAGNGKVVQEIIPDGFLGHTGETPFKQDIAKAKDLLAKAGVKEGTEIELLIPSGTAPGGVDVATLGAKLQNDIEKIGLKINIKQVQTSELLNIYRAQKGQLVLIYWGPDFPDPDGNVSPFTNYDLKSIAWRNAWEAKDIGDLAKQAAIEADSAKRTALYKQITERVLNEGPYAVLYQPTRTFGVRKNIAGFQSYAISTPQVWFWLISKS